MSSAGRAASSSGCVARPKEHATGLIGFAVQIRRSSLIGSCVMEAAEHREPCESRGSRTDLGAPGGVIPPGDSTKADKPSPAKIQRCPLLSESDQITDLAALHFTLTHSESWSRFRVWWLACAAVERQDLQRASLSHGRAN